MRTFTPDQMREVLDKHAAWLRGEPTGERADLSWSNLSRSNLLWSDLSWSNLSGSNLSGAEGSALVVAMTRILPAGDLIGWKKCSDGVLVKLRIPADAKRSHAFGRKCRAEYVDVLEVIGAEVGVTTVHGHETRYVPGERVTPDKWDDNWQQECSHGIHFFITREEAEAWS